MADWRDQAYGESELVVVSSDSGVYLEMVGEDVALACKLDEEGIDDLINDLEAKR